MTVPVNLPVQQFLQLQNLLCDLGEAEFCVFEEEGLQFSGRLQFKTDNVKTKQTYTETLFNLQNVVQETTKFVLKVNWGVQFQKFYYNLLIKLDLLDIQNKFILEMI